MEFGQLNYLFDLLNNGCTAFLLIQSLLMKAKEEIEKAGLKLNIQKTSIISSSPITSWQIDGETMETVTGSFLGLQNHCGW